MSSFSITRKKTPFQKHREEEEAKKKVRFLGLRMKQLVCMLNFWSPFKGMTRVKGFCSRWKFQRCIWFKEGSRYVPSFIPPPMATKGKEEKQKEEERPKDKGKGKARNIDFFMEELKHEQEMRERRNQEREQWSDGRPSATSTLSSRFDELPDEFDPSGKFGSFDDGDPQTTNLYVGNLAPQVDENFLLRTLEDSGPLLV
uniref:Putative nucleotide-binding alpha-beta plait domain-containing protein n=1 Tax=Helianthus annuus TaxID=4232 RepID=A0A251V9Z6_HELAN